MPCSILWMSLCEFLLRRRLNGRENYTSPGSLRDRSSPNIMLKFLQQQVSFSWQHSLLIISGSCDHLGSGTREWILFLRTILLIPPDIQRHFWSMLRTNTALNIDDFPWLNLRAYRATICSLPQWHLDLINLLMIHMICPAIMKNT